MIPVFVDGAAPDDPTTLALISACSQVVKPESCVLASEDTALARVYWPGPLRAEIQVDSGPHHEDRIIEFQAADLPKARWQAAGLIAGSLLQDVKGTGASPSSSINPASADKPEGGAMANGTPRAAKARTPPPSSKRSQNAPGRPPTNRLPQATDPKQKPAELGRGPLGFWRDLGIFAGLGALTGLGLTPKDGGFGPARIGGFAQLEFRAWNGLGIAALAQFSVTALSLEGVGGRWQSVAIGPVYAHQLSAPITLILQAAVTREALRLTWGDEQQQHAYWGWLVAAGVEARLTDALALSGQVGISVAPEQPVRIAGAGVGQQPQFSPILLAGARWRLF